MSSPSCLTSEYKIDNTVINKYVVQSLMSQSQNARRQTAVGQVFKMCEKLIEFDSNKSDTNLKIQIKNLIDNKFNNNHAEKAMQDKLKSYKVDLEKVYPLNKPGNFGRVLQRKCRLVPKGVMQYEDSKQAKLKQVKGFINRIEHVQNKELTDLAWTSTFPQKYKFRIILLDNNQNKKGIYFENYEQAENVRAYFCYKYKKPALNSQVFLSLKYQLLQSNMHGFVQKILTKNDLMRKKKNETQKLISSKLNSEGEVNFSMNKSKIEEDDHNKSTLFNKNDKSQVSLFQSRHRKQQNASVTYKGGFLDDIISNHNLSNESQKINLTQSRFMGKNNNSVSNVQQKFQQLNGLYRRRFFQNWKNAALGSHTKSRNKKAQTGGGRMKPHDMESSIEEEDLLDLGSRMLDTKQNTHASRKTQIYRKPTSLSVQSSQPNRRLLNTSQERNPFNESIILGRNNIDQSPIKPNSRIEKILGHSRKQQSIFTYPQKIQEENLSVSDNAKNINKKLGTEKITFRSIQFMEDINQQTQKQNNTGDNLPKNPLLFKPIITITALKRDPKQESKVSKNDKTQKKNEKSYRSKVQDIKGEFVFNTILKKVYRTSEYQLIATEGQSALQTDENLNNFYLRVTVINFLTNQEINQSEISLKDFCFSSKLNSIVDKKSFFRIKFEYKNTGLAAPEAVYKINQYSEASLFISFPKIDPQIILKIKTFWETEAISNSYYNLEDNFNIFDAVSNSSNEAQPLTWWIDLDQSQYNYLCILQSSSFILGYKLIKPMLYLIRAIKNINFKIQKIIEIILSVIINLGKCYYFPEEINKINYLHREIGLPKGKIQFINRVYLESLLFQKFFSLECPELFEKFLRKNICISHLMLQYTYELFTRNFGIEVLCEFWNYCSLQMVKVPFIFFLTTLSLCRLLNQKLLSCKRLSEVREVFESKSLRSPAILLNEIKYLRLKYFHKGQGLIEQIKQAFEQRPFEGILKNYFKKIEEKQANEKKEKNKFKRQACSRLLQQVSFEQAMGLLTKPQSSKKYILHIYFYQQPQITGKMVLTCGKNEYESVSSEKNRYFIIGDISSQVFLKYIDFKGNIYLGELVFNLGFNEFKSKISCKKGEQFQVHYLCGLLTQTHIQLIKSNKKYSHFLGPNIEKSYFLQELLKPLKQNRGLSGQQQFFSQQWFKDLKSLFSFGNKLFNQIEFFLYLLNEQKITYEQKLSKLRLYSLSLSREFFLCHNQIVYKHLVNEFYKFAFIPLKQTQFECYFSDAVHNEFSAPKIIKCRLFCNGKEIHLQKQIIEFYCRKTSKNMYGDLYVDQIVSICENHIKSKLSSFTEGQVKLLYSSFGQIKLKVIYIKMQSKQLKIDSSRMISTSSIFHEISQKQPEILMTQILPSFSKISTILDYVNSSRNIDLRSKINDQDRRVIPQSINLLKYVQSKFKNCLFLRYDKYPTKVQVPFFSYFYQLQQQVQTPKFKYYYLNNVKDSVKSICLCKDHLKFSSNNKEQDQQFDKSLGLFGNLRKIKIANGKANTVFFWVDHKQDHIPFSLVCVNYGYGVVRWEKCIIKKFRRKQKQRLDKKGPANDSSRKMQYEVQINQKKYFAREYQVKVNPLVKDNLLQHEQHFQVKFSQVESDIKQGLNFLLNPLNLQDFVKSVKNR